MLFLKPCFSVGTSGCQSSVLFNKTLCCWQFVKMCDSGGSFRFGFQNVALIPSDPSRCNADLPSDGGSAGCHTVTRRGSWRNWAGDFTEDQPRKKKKHRWHIRCNDQKRLRCHQQNIYMYTYINIWYLYNLSDLWDTQTIKIIVQSTQASYNMQRSSPHFARKY